MANELMKAAQSNDLPKVRELLEAGEPPDGGVDDASPLIHAALCGNLDLARLLVQFGADVRKRDRSKWTPLAYARLSGNLEIAEFLETSMPRRRRPGKIS